jgi:putative transposase
MQVVAWDITYLRNSLIRGNYFFLYLFLDIWSRKIVGWSVHERQSSELAAQLLQCICDDTGTEGFVVHSDNGAAMKGSSMLATFQALGIISSYSRPSVSDDNAFPESLFRHLKYVPSFPREGFYDLQQARQWVERFVQWYNHVHLHSSIAYVTPQSRHEGSDIQQLAQRREVYQQARQRNPRRWTGNTRAWHRPAIVTLNPDRVVKLNPKKCSTAA